MKARDLVDRLEALERRCRRLQIWGATLSVLLGAALLAGLRPVADDVVRARTFLVVDGSGQELGFLGLPPEQDAGAFEYCGLCLRAPKGDANVDLAVGSRSGNESMVSFQLEAGDLVGDNYAIANLAAGAGIAAMTLTDDENTKLRIRAEKNVAEVSMEAFDVDQQAPSVHGRGALQLQLSSGAPSIAGRAKTGDTIVKLP